MLVRANAVFQSSEMLYCELSDAMEQAHSPLFEDIIAKLLIDPSVVRFFQSQLAELRTI